MKTVTLTAKYTDNQIVLTEPHLIPENAQLLVTVLPFSDQGESDDEFRADWLAMSAATLANAYSSDEPDYSQCIIKEPNPDYGQR